MKEISHKGTKAQNPPAGGPYKKELKGMPCSVFPCSMLLAFQPLCLRVLVAKKRSYDEDR
jgi:hypothetical protein